MATGTFIKDSQRDGLGELTIKNGWALDAVAVLSLGQDPAAAVYICTGDSFTIPGIRDGIYYLYFTQGEDWDGDLGAFTRKLALERFEESLSFETISGSEGTQYSAFEVTLYETPGGTAETLPVDPSQFPNLK